MFTVVVFSDGRNDYLESTLRSFSEAVRFPEAPYVILVDDMPDGRDVRRVEGLAKRFGVHQIVWNPSNLGQFDAVMAGWSNVPPDAEFVFHLENDFVFPAPVTVSQLVRVLEEPSIVNVTLLRQPWYPDERAAGGLLYVRPERFREARVGGEHIRVSLHRDYFGFNPGLYRRGTIRQLERPSTTSSEVPWLEVVMRDRLLDEDPSREFAVLGWRGDPPSVIHIGHRRVGVSPDHGGPSALPGANEVRPEQMDRERGILTTRLQRWRSHRPAAASTSADENDPAGMISTLERSTMLDQVGGTGPPSRPLENPVMILLYHRIAALNPDPSRLCVGPKDFRAHMEALARQWEPVSLDVIADGVAHDALPTGAAAVTLDDGYADAMTASEILLDLGIPVTFFVTSSGGELIHDTVARVMLGRDQIPDRLDLTSFSPGLLIDTTDRAAAFHAVNEIVWRLNADDRRRLLDRLAVWSDCDLSMRESHRLLIPMEIRDLASRPGHTIGAHTVNHLLLTAHPRSTRHEVVESMEYLRWVTNRPVRHLAYPYGGFDQNVVATCRNLGVESAVTTASRFVAPWDDPLLLPRFEVSRDNLPTTELGFAV